MLQLLKDERMTLRDCVILRHMRMEDSNSLSGVS